MPHPTPSAVKWSIVTLACLLVAVTSALSPPPAAAQSNPIVIENQQPGTDQWQISWGRAGNDVAGQIKGYASATSVNKGENVTFHVSVNPVQTYTIDVYRIGWYQGLGGRFMQRIGPLTGVPQPACPTDPLTGLIECQWAPAHTLTAPTSWTSGLYLALLTNAEGRQNYIMFVVRDDSRSAPLLYQQPVTTYQAYNDYPYDSATGKSLYDFNSYGANTVASTKRAVKVSFDRPYLGDGQGADWGHFILYSEVNFVRWMEKSGYDVTYSTDMDLHTNGGRLLNYRGFISAGHDEYWSKQMYDAVVAARDAGVNLAFFSANAIYTQVRFEPSSGGVPNRVMVCYRDAALDPIADPGLKTVNWRDVPVNRPEQTVLGAQYTNMVLWAPQYQGYAPHVVTNSVHWVYAGTGFVDGDSVPGIVGYEADRLFSNYAPPPAVGGTHTLLSHSPFMSTKNTPDHSSVSIYQAASGAWVFSSGTMGWSWALDNYHGWNVVDARLQRTTANLLDRFVTAVTPADFTLTASPSTQTVTAGAATTYGVTVNPAHGFAGEVSLSLSGLPGGATGSFTPNPATASSTLSVSTTAATPAGSHTLTITGASGSLTRTSTVTLVVTAPPDFTLSASPASRSVLPGSSTTYGVTINAANGFADPVTLSVSGLPAGAGADFGPNPASASSTLSVTTSPATPAGSYTLTISGTGGALTRTTSVTLVVSDFTLSASPASQTVTAGGSTSYSVTISPIGGFTGQVTLSVSGLPGGATAGFTPNPASVSSTLSVATSTSTPAGSYTLTITGVSGTLTRTTSVTLVVSDFTLSASPASQTVAAGAGTSYLVTINPTPGFSGQVTLSVSGLPQGAGGSFTPNPASASSTLSVTTTASTPGGTYTLTITGVSGTLTRTAAVSLVVTRVVFDNAVSSGIHFGVSSITTPPFVIGSGANRAAMIMVALSSSSVTNITASLGGASGTVVPGTDSGMTASIRTVIFQVVDPPPGAQTATVSWTNGFLSFDVNADVGVITVSGADQTTPVTGGTFAANDATPSASTSVTIASNPGDLTASVGYTADGWVSPATSQTLTWGVDSEVAGGDIGPGTGTATHTWTDQYMWQTHAVSGASFKAAATP